MRNLIKYIAIAIFFLNTSCEKGWLDVKSSKSLVIPKRLEDLQAILDNSSVMNGNSSGGIMPILGEVGSDDYILDPQVWNTMNATHKNAYVWSEDIFEGNQSNDWNKPYITVFYANTVLDELDNIPLTADNELAYNNVRGSALFYRANSFFHLAQIFASPFSIADNPEDSYGVPLRLTADFNEQSARPSLRDTYSQLLADLNEAYDLLPDTAAYKTRPSKLATSALLARIYLCTGDYGKALEQANSCLSIYDNLIDFNDVNIEATLPFPRFNNEVIFDNTLNASAAIENHRVNPALYELYSESDLRKVAFFDSTSDHLRFKGSYSNSNYWLFSGLTTGEIYLIRAECKTRLGDIPRALGDLNFLLEHRMKRENDESTHAPYEIDNADELLHVILKERRKELVFRGIRWLDLRRLNQEGFSIKQSRQISGAEYVLEPNSPRYTYPIPDDVIIATGMPQNQR